MSVAPLSLICMQSIIRSSEFKTIEGVLTVYKRIDFDNPTYELLKKETVYFLGQRYPMLLEKYGYEELKLIFYQEDLETFEKQLSSNLEAKKRFSTLKGTVLEPTDDWSKLNIANNDGYYPIQALIQGAAWPPGIDPTRREDYLSPDEFFATFKMTRDEYNLKDKHIRLRLKKQCKLF